MNVLILGDEHSYGYGLRAGQLSYVGHFVRQVSRVGQSIRVEVHTPPTAPGLLNTLDQLPLREYDLILVQTERVANELSPPAWPGLTWPGLTWPGLTWLDHTPATLTALLARLRPFRHTVVLITPLPKQDWTTRLRHNRLRTLLMRGADRQSLSLFDTNQILLPRQEYFLTNDGQHLNAVSHELLGRSLFAFYQAAPTIVTVGPIRRG